MGSLDLIGIGAATGVGVFILGLFADATFKLGLQTLLGTGFIIFVVGGATALVLRAL